MEAKTFISKKRDAAIDELKAIEAEYLPRLNAAKAMIEMTQKWMDELASERANVESPVMQLEPAKLTVVSNNVEPEGILREIPRAPSENWVSARDLLPKVRQAS